MIDPETEAELSKIMREHGRYLAENFFLVDPRDHVDAETHQIFLSQFEDGAKELIRSFIERLQAGGRWQQEAIDLAETYAFEGFRQRYDVLLAGSGHGSA
ncbi:hypothetical protein [Mesorhizobium sp. M0239]|uniref:hypothetical protein n=1 Tax=Mesorhizobium sp. M0239 TaxID=2956924 RepID=UPI00333A352D